MTAFNYWVGETNPTTLTMDPLTNNRNCHFCTGGPSTGVYKIASFTVPMTATNTVTGLDIVASVLGSSNNDVYNAKSTVATATVYKGANLTAACAVAFGSGSSTTTSYKG